MYDFWDDQLTRVSLFHFEFSLFMKLAVAQFAPIKGHIEANITQHFQLMELAAAEGAAMIVFPELSLTGYEPELARERATNKDDARLDALQQLTDELQLLTCAGIPLNGTGGVNIGMIIFRPGQPRSIYTKQYLHEDELPYFIVQPASNIITVGDQTIALAICYELSVAAHQESIRAAAATIYIASVAKTAAGMQKSMDILSNTALTYHLPVLISNSTGPSDNFIAGGQTAALNSQGKLLAALNAYPVIQPV
jgi:predicted amidohydrolase